LFSGLLSKQVIQVLLVNPVETELSSKGSQLFLFYIENILLLKTSCIKILLYRAGAVNSNSEVACIGLFPVLPVVVVSCNFCVGGGGYGGTVVISSCLSPVFRNDEHPVWTKSVFRGFWHRKKKLVKSWDK